MDSFDPIKLLAKNKGLEQARYHAPAQLYLAINIRVFGATAPPDPASQIRINL
jgi:hypothetical protein